MLSGLSFSTKGFDKGLAATSGGMAVLWSSDGLEVGDTEDGATGLVGEALDFPTVRENDLLNDGEAEAGALALLLHGEVGFENLGAAFGGDARTVVAHFEDDFRGVEFLGRDLDRAAGVDRLNGV